MSYARQSNARDAAYLSFVGGDHHNSATSSPFHTIAFPNNIMELSTLTMTLKPVLTPQYLEANMFRHHEHNPSTQQSQLGLDLRFSYVGRASEGRTHAYNRLLR